MLDKRHSAGTFLLPMFLLAGLAHAGERAAEPVAEPANVMMMGVFHFANPGLDMVKSKVLDVTKPENQAYLDGLALRIAAFNPTDVLIECDPADQKNYDTEFGKFAAGNFALPVNENYQIGFRVAKAANLAGVTCFDESKIGWDAGPMFDFMKQHEPRTQAAMDALFTSMGETMAREQATLSLPQLLQLTNDQVRDRQNKALYLRTNAVGAGLNFTGADATASWWHRNFRMYANVQQAAAPGHRVLVIAGQGHTAILKDLLAIDSQRQAEDVKRYLEPDVAGGAMTVRHIHAHVSPALATGNPHEGLPLPVADCLRY